LVADGKKPAARDDLPREDGVGCVGVVDEHGAVARFDDQVADEAPVRRVVVKHPAAAVNEHEDWEFLGDVLRADEVQDDLESINGDALLAFGDPGVIDGNGGLSGFEDLSRLERRELFEFGRHRRVERFQECSCSARQSLIGVEVDDRARLYSLHTIPLPKQQGPKQLISPQ
jgi:hypothetical protein